MRRNKQAAAAIIRRLSALLDTAVYGVGLIGACAIALMMLHVTLDVLIRSLFNIAMPGTLTIVTHYYMPLAIFSPLALAEHRNAHISVDVLFTRFTPTAQRRLTTIMLIASSTLVILLSARGGTEALRHLELGTVQVQGTAAISIWPTYLIVPVGAGLWAAVLVRRFATTLAAAEEHSRPECRTR